MTNEDKLNNISIMDRMTNKDITSHKCISSQRKEINVININ